MHSSYTLIYSSCVTYRKPSIVIPWMSESIVICTFIATVSKVVELIFISYINFPPPHWRCSRWRYHWWNLWWIWSIFLIMAHCVTDSVFWSLFRSSRGQQSVRAGMPPALTKDFNGNELEFDSIIIIGWFNFTGDL